MLLHDDEAVRVRAQVTEFLTANTRPGSRAAAERDAIAVPVEA
jgi:hypothetical protein